VRSLRHERDDALRDLNICKEQTRTWIAEVDRWKAEARNYSTGSLHALTSFLSCFYVHAYTIGGQSAACGAWKHRYVSFSFFGMLTMPHTHTPPPALARRISTKPT